jgi:hypothetical protein
MVDPQDQASQILNSKLQELLTVVLERLISED